uniref:G_PROTEIN_RECEP_F1_2 domain-containing protein n=1 Tax=Haemonchus contortus TaxID=6289 RepID=A0A7I4YZI6_HAECO
MAKLSSDDIIAVGIIEGLGVLGLASNGLAMLILIKGGKISHSFQQLCFSNCTANFICLALFVLYCAPMIILQSNFSHTSPIAKLISGFMVAIWDVSVYSHLMSSINRLIVISWPIESRKILNQRNTKVLIGVAWFLGFLHFIPYFRVDQCYIVFYASKYIWEFSPNYCGFVLGKVLDFGTGVSVFVLIITFDLYTVLRIRTIMKVEHGWRQRQELKFFAQSCLQFCIFVVKLSNFYFISEYFVGDHINNRWPAFFTTTFLWELTHCVDGFILIPFHYKDWRRRDNVLPVIA